MISKNSVNKMIQDIMDAIEERDLEQNKEGIAKIKALWAAMDKGGSGPNDWRQVVFEEPADEKADTLPLAIEDIDIINIKK